jgi:plasmid stability protein
MARTVTLDADVEARLNAEAERRGTAPEELANEVLRRGLEGEPETRRKFVVRARHMGKPLIDLDCTGRALQSLDELERR